MADPAVRPLSVALASALRRAVGLAVGTCVVALLLAAALEGEAAERFATTAYLAAIFLAAVLVINRFFRESASTRPSAVAAFPSFLSYSIGVVIFLSVGATLVSQPGGEVLALFACFALIAVVAAIRCGAVAALNELLVRGGILAAAARYAVLGTVCALGIAALAGGDAAEAFAHIAYRLMIAVALFLTAVLLAPGSVGVRLQRAYERVAATVDRLVRAFVFERTATYAAFAAVAALFVASLMPFGLAEPFAIVAYLCAVGAAVGVAMECRRLRS